MRDRPSPEDAQAFERWYGAEHRRLVGSLWFICGDADLAADVAADAFSRAWERWGRVQHMDSPRGWVRQVAVNALRRRLRRRAHEARLLRRDRPRSEPPPNTDVDLWRAVGALPDRQKEAICLRYVAGCTEREVAEAMGISEGAASAHLVKARQALSERLTHQDGAKP